MEGDAGLMRNPLVTPPVKLQLPHGVGGGRDVVGKLAQKLGHAGIPLFSVGVIPEVIRQILHHTPQPDAQLFRALRRDGVPRVQIGVAHTFLGVLRNSQNTPGNAAAEGTVFSVGLGDRLLIP